MRLACDLTWSAYKLASLIKKKEAVKQDGHHSAF